MDKFDMKDCGPPVLRAVLPFVVVCIFKIAILIPVHSVAAQSLEAEVSQTSEALKKGDITRGLEKALDTSIRLRELYKHADLAANNELMQSLDKASKVLAREPFELGDLYADIKADAERFRRVQPKAPRFGNPLNGVEEWALRSNDPAVRSQALEAARSNGRALHTEYRRRLGRFREQRHAAQKLLNKAESTYEHGRQVTDLLGDLNGSPSGVMLNALGQKLTYQFLDMAIYIQPALAERLSEARTMTSRYDTVIASMEKEIAQYRSFDQWAAFYSFQDWARLQPTVPTDFLDRAREALRSATAQRDRGEAINAPSVETARINGALNQAAQLTKSTKARAQELMRAAQAADQRAASAAEFAAIINLASSLYSANNGNGGAGDGGSRRKAIGEPPSVIIPEPVIELKTEGPWDSETNTDPPFPSIPIDPPD